LLDEKYNLIQEKVKVILSEKEVYKGKYDLQLIEYDLLKEKVHSFLSFSCSLTILSLALPLSLFLYQNEALETKLQKLSRSMDSEKLSQQSYQKSLNDTEEQLLRLTRSLDESKADCFLMRKQISEVPFFDPLFGSFPQLSLLPLEW
jgi:septal ring factor EnvC (AmiA/AmiB activator)